MFGSKLNIIIILTIFFFNKIKAENNETGTIKIEPSNDTKIEEPLPPIVGALNQTNLVNINQNSTIDKPIELNSSDSVNKPIELETNSTDINTKIEMSLNDSNVSSNDTFEADLNDQSNDNQLISSENEAQNITNIKYLESKRNFSIDFLKEVNKLNRKENIFVSPHSTYETLLLLYMFSRGQTGKSLKDGLRLPQEQDKFNIYKAFKNENNLLNTVSNTSNEFITANRIYIPFESVTKFCLEILFNEFIEKVDFRNNTEEVRLHINEWVKNTTKDQINDLIQPNSIKETTDLVLVNAAYFKGFWKYPFYANVTQPGAFYISETEKVMTDVMHLDADLIVKKLNGLEADILQLPYTDEDSSMFILLPTKGHNVNGVLNNLTENIYHKIADTRTDQIYPVTVQMPKFTVEKRINLIPILSKLGLENLFNGNVDLSQLTGQKTQQITDAFQKSKIIVNEIGTEAASATAILETRFGGGKFFACNKPFVYFIHKKSINTILFSGVYRMPEN